ncbi:MAG TPA: acyl carrier protein [Actinomycetota bacterium]|nr:acyl carrier protein [Actinomycetota bacterium]
MIEQASSADDLEAHRTQIRTFISKAFKGRPLEDEEDIFATGFVNSLFAMELVTFIEKAFGITVESEDLDLDNFRSVASVAAFVGRKLGNGSAPVTTPA